MLSYISKTTSNVKTTFNLTSVLDYWIPSIQQSQQVANLKQAQKEQQIGAIQIHVPNELEEAILAAESAQDIIVGYIEKEWTCQQVMMVFCRLATQTDKVNGCLGEVMFEEAMMRAQLLDQYLDQTGNLIGRLVLRVAHHTSTRTPI